MGVRFSTRIRNALTAAGMKWIGDVGEASDATLLNLRDLGPGSVAFSRENWACLRPRECGRKLAMCVAGRAIASTKAADFETTKV
ncbi:DNA-directed RNA polymerase subunit alpha C-terminal domain-containing protein [Bradyrhizobium sp. AUGA SZCCT0182]|uniref:DNA-directed RNA polymerase subunit alpha C-terminal domain-containing protein n=1 Tax=Bradyrhizobium sp. AUGA SZCCT0182 TaxID=2807667 RepID=UPI00390C5A05